MRVAYADKRLEDLARKRRSKHYSEQIARRILKFVDFAKASASEQDLRNMVSLGYHNLKGEREGQRAVRLTGNWRLIVTVERQDDGEIVMLLEVVDYH
jgi:proteic killer suppression protein